MTDFDVLEFDVLEFDVLEFDVLEFDGLTPEATVRFATATKRSLVLQKNLTVVFRVMSLLLRVLGVAVQYLLCLFGRHFVFARLGGILSLPVWATFRGRFCRFALLYLLKAPFYNGFAARF